MYWEISYHESIFVCFDSRVYAWVIIREGFEYGEDGVQTEEGYQGYFGRCFRPMEETGLSSDGNREI